MTRPIVAQSDGDVGASLSIAGQSTDDVTHPAPVVWLVGKVQSGKTSIVRAITRSSDVEIGNGFKACTQTARVFDFPDARPTLRFLDTRGLGEAAYDPTEDLAYAERQAHVMLVVMRAMDHTQGAIIEVVGAARRRNPDMPVVVAQTSLHEGYVERGRHVVPYPFYADDGRGQSAQSVAPDLLRALDFQRQLFSRIAGKAPIAFVPIDFTQAGDEFDPVDYGIEALTDALVRVAPEAMRPVLEGLPGLAVDGRVSASEPIIRKHAFAAAGSELVPIAGAVAVSAVQMRLLRELGRLYGVAWERRILAEFAVSLGAGVAVRTLVGFGVRQLAKLIPVYGQTAAAAASSATSFGVTFALGKAAVYFLGRRQRGLHVTGTAAVYQAGLREAFRQAREAGADQPKSQAPT